LKKQLNKKNICQHAVWQNGGFGDFLERKFFNQKFVYICKGLVLKNRHFAKLLDVSSKH